jgi:hypothetical protein
MFKLLRRMQYLHQPALDYQGLTLVTMVTTPLLCDEVMPVNQRVPQLDVLFNHSKN